MRTTIHIDDALYRRAKELAARSGRTVGQVIEDALRESLQTRGNAARQELTELPVFGGSSTLPGVDIADNAALLDLLDEGEPLDELR